VNTTNFINSTKSITFWKVRELNNSSTLIFNGLDPVKKIQNQKEIIMKRKIVRLVLVVSVLFAFTSCMGVSHLGHSGSTPYQSGDHSSHQSGGGSHSGGCH
jgi:hypothetical protein